MNTLHLGQKVRNLGELATVVGFHEKTGNPILEGADGSRWIAYSDECEDPEELWKHSEGVVILS